MSNNDPSPKKVLRVALAGNPNSGKTTLFNAITGAHQHVGNYPGVTVEKREGSARHNGVELLVQDLPGTYSLTPYSAEESVARNQLLDNPPDVLINVVDASNLERNLYLSMQLLELGVPIVLAFNMHDLAEARGLTIDRQHLSQLLGVPIIPAVASKGQGVPELLDAALETAANRQQALLRQRPPLYGEEVEPHVQQLADAVAAMLGESVHARWFAVKLLERDEPSIARLQALLREQSPQDAPPCQAAQPGQAMVPTGVAALDALLTQTEKIRKHLQGVFGETCEIVLADLRYGLISGACAETVKREAQLRQLRGDQLDMLFLNRYLGLPAFAVMMFLVFQFTFLAGNPLVTLLESLKDYLAQAVRNWGGPDSILAGLLADGVIEGVGAVLQFVPLIAMLYLSIAILEDTGYMARAAFLLDRWMHKIGLHGKSFIPMLIGFGCTVPGILATRTLETRRDRLTTMLVLPLMSCGARLPVYLLILGAMFPARPLLTLAVGQTRLFEITNQALILFGLYTTGIVLAIFCTAVLRRTALRGEVTPFVMELPPYRLPTLKGLAIHVGERTWQYIKKAGTVILCIVILLWALKTWPALPQNQVAEFDHQKTAIQAAPASDANAQAEQLLAVDLARHQAELKHSTIGQIGQFIAPVMKPCGFDWKISTALAGSLTAKEVFVGQIGVIYAIPEHQARETASLRERLAADYTPLQGLAVMLFILIGSPCMSTLAVTFRESGSWKWALLQWSYLTSLAWLVAAAVYQIGHAMGG